MLQSWGSQRVGHYLGTEEQEQNKENWATKQYIARHSRQGLQSQGCFNSPEHGSGWSEKNGSFCLTEFLFVSEGGIYYNELMFNSKVLSWLQNASFHPNNIGTISA